MKHIQHQYINVSPAIAVIEENACEKLVEIIKDKSRVAVLISPELRHLYQKFLARNLHRFKVAIFDFGGECSWPEIKKQARQTRNFSVLVGVGGGKALDTAKCVAEFNNQYLVLVPTSAATCSAWTALAAIYTPSGQYRSYRLFDRAADVCIIDYSLIATAPWKLLFAGVSDALAKYYETKVFIRDKVVSPEVDVAKKISEEIYRRIRKIFKNKKITFSDFKELVFTNIVLAGMVGGLGGEGCRAAAAHAIANGLTQVPHSGLHGELVGYGLLLQLLLEKDFSELKFLDKLFRRFGLLRRLKDFGIDFNSLGKVIRWATSPEETMKNIGRQVGISELKNALLMLEKL